MPAGEYQKQLSQDKLYAFVSWLHDSVNGYGVCPSSRSIARALGYRDATSVTGWLRRAEAAGWVIPAGKPGKFGQRGMIRVMKPQRGAIAPKVKPAPRKPEVAIKPSVLDTAFSHWLMTAEKGARCIYFEGHLAEERGKPKASRNETALAEAMAAAQAAEDGLVVLTTKRVDGEMVYLAIRTDKPLPKLVRQ